MYPLLAHNFEMRIAVVGAGPSGLFLGHRLLRLNPSLQLTYYEARPVPFGLVRFGVAPDHPEVKNCTKIFDSVLASSNVKCLCGVFVGSHGTGVTLTSLLRTHSIVVLATGLEKPRNPSINHRNLLNHFSSAEFVAWYNNDCSVRPVHVDLHSTKRAAVIGHGNVALDIARILLKPWWSYADTSISDNALKELQRSSIETVDLIGRRGPLQISFTRAELKEVLELKKVSFRTNSDIVHTELQKFDSLLVNDRPKRRLFELLKPDFWQGKNGASKTLNLDFYQSPKELTGSYRVSGLWLERNRPVDEACSSIEDLKNARVEGSGSLEHRPYQLVISSTGFENHCTFGLPTYGSNGPICNVNGQVTGCRNLFVTGWVATGAVGDLSSTMRHSYVVADSIHSLLNDSTLKT